MTTKPFKLALAQMTVEGGDVPGNLRRAEQHVQRAARAGADVVLLPEALDAGWTHPSSRLLAEPIPGGTAFETFRRSARDNGVFVCAGLTERSGNQVFNAAVIVSPQGELLLHHRKLNELDIGHDVYDQGDRLGVCETPFGAMGLMICADGYVRGQFIARSLGIMGADVILSPCAWAVPPGYDNAKQPYGRNWRENYGCVARDFRLWIAGCSNVGEINGGPWKGHSCIGCSLVVGPSGEPAVKGDFGANEDNLILVDIAPQPRPARGTSWGKLWEQAGSPDPAVAGFVPR